MTVLPPFEPPRSHKELAMQASAVEARHFAAVYTLFRISSMKNIHMMLPPKYKDLWKGEFQSMKSDDVKEGKAWMYEADPFLALKERQEAQAAAQKKRDEAARQREKEANQPRAPGVVPGGPSAGGSSRMKGWSRAPRVDMGKKTRQEIERLIRRDAVWNPHNVIIPPERLAAVVEEVTALGFRRSHVQEAAQICKDREEILEWLLIHVPEDDLPAWSLPENYSAGVSMASGNLQREAAIGRLAATGYSKEHCEEVYDKFGGEMKAALILQASLLDGEDAIDNLAESLSGLEIDSVSNDGSTEWQEEQTVLASIYDDRYKTKSQDICEIALEITSGPQKPFLLRLQRPPGPYPNALPIVSIIADLPAYIRLSMTKRVLIHAKENFLGEQMVFNLVDWLEREAPSIIENPGKLSEISTASEPTPEMEIRKRHNRRAARPNPVSWEAGTPQSMQILSRWQAKQGTPAQQRMLQTRMSLPAWSLQEEIVHQVTSCQVTIISGETGSGKSTQSVQFILDDLIQRTLGGAANIICTQPRRISALGLADRVADERCSEVGNEVGYAIRGESKQKAGTTKITFVTTGVLLRRLQTSGGNTDDLVSALSDVSHVVVDEVHERSLDTDFLLILLREVLKRRSDLRVVLMSATLDAAVFEQYFSDVGRVGKVQIEGRTYPVQDFYLDNIIHMTGFGGRSTVDEEWEDDESASKSVGGILRGIGMRINYDLIAEVVRSIDQHLGSQSGGILIFLPGTAEIDRTLQVR